MRRMRDFPWRYVFLALPLAGVAGALHFAFRELTHDPSSNLASTAATNASTVAVVAGAKHAGADDDSSGRDPASSAEREHGARRIERPVASERAATKGGAHKVVDVTLADAGSDRSPAAASTTTSNNSCMSIEYRGDGPEATRVTQEQWGEVMKEFHGAKGELLAWLGKHRASLSKEGYDALESRVRELRIQRPPQDDESDLNWRGVSVLSQDSHHEPILRLGSGFVQLVLKQPVRARFELARVVAQSWSPCDVAKAGSPGIWDPLLSCLGVDPKAGCGEGGFAENAWAVSTALAETVAPAGCRIPAFEGAGQECLKNFSLSKPGNIQATAPATPPKREPAQTIREPAQIHEPAAPPAKPVEHQVPGQSKHEGDHAETAPASSHRFSQMESSGGHRAPAGVVPEARKLDQDIEELSSALKEGK